MIRKRNWSHLLAIKRKRQRVHWLSTTEWRIMNIILILVMNIFIRMTDYLTDYPVLFVQCAVYLNRYCTLVCAFH